MERDAELLERVGHSAMFRFGMTPPNRSDVDSPLIDEDFMDMSDTLFSALTQNAFPFPTHRELSKAPKPDDATTQLCLCQALQPDGA